MKLGFIVGAFIFIALIILSTITSTSISSNSVFASEECSKTKTARMADEYMFVRDYTFGGTLGDVDNLGEFLQGEMHKFIERKGAGADIILLSSLEVNKIYKSFVIKVRMVEFLFKQEQPMCVSRGVKYLGANYEEEEKNYRIRGRCLEYFFHDMEEDVTIKIYLNCGWVI